MEHRRVLLDLETQQDFFLPGGTCYTKEASAVAANIRRLFAWARQRDIPVISTVLRVRRSQIGPLAKVPHCVEGTRGERKLPGTVLRPCIDFGLRGTTDLPRKVLGHYQQVIFEKRVTDIFAHPRLERMITELPPCVFVVCGAGLAKGIAQAAIGLRNRGFGVILARDAVVDLGDAASEMACRRMEAKGVIFAPAAEIIAPTPAVQPRPFRHAETDRMELARHGR